MRNIIKKTVLFSIKSFSKILLRLFPKGALALSQDLKLVSSMKGAPKIKMICHSIPEYTVRRDVYLYDYNLVEWLKEGTEEDILFDVGANVGGVSLCAVKQFSYRKCIAIEPMFNNYSSLCENILANEASEQILPFPVALSSKKGITDFLLNSFMPGSSFHSLEKGESNVKQKLKVNVDTLDHLIEYYQLPMPTRIKIDVDGLDLEVLRGAQQVLRNLTLKTIFIETMTPDAKLKIESFLKPFGFFIHKEFREDLWFKRDSEKVE